MIDRIWQWAMDRDVSWLAYICYEAEWIKDKVAPR